MGCINSLVRRNKDLAYRNELGNPLLKVLASDLPPDTKVIVIRLRGLKDLQSPSTNLSGSADPFVEMKMLPDDSIAGDQLQKSSVKPNTTSPSWIPEERFQYIISGKMEGKIVFSVYSFRPALGPLPIADAIINLKDIDLDLEPKRKILKLISPETGKSAGSAIIDIQTLTMGEALNIQEQTIFQYQRWQPVIEWGSTKPGHFSALDPGQWSSVDGKHYFDQLEKAAVVQDNWFITKHWFTLATEDDPEGWFYATNFGDINWHSRADKAAALMVRRRAWRRELSREAPRSVSSASNTGAELTKSN